MKVFNNIKTKIVVTLLVTVIGALASFGLVQYSIRKAALTQELHAFADYTVARLSQQLQLPIWIFDEVQIDNTMDALMLDHRINTVLLFDNQGGIRGKTRGPDNMPVDTNAEIKGSFITRQAEINHRGDRLGHVAIYLTDELINSQLRNETRTLLMTVFVLSAVLLIVLYFTLSKIVTRPISLLLDLTNSMAVGDFEQGIEIKQKDEIGLLAGSFTSMQENLRLREIERDRALTDLKESERRWWNLFENSPVALVEEDYSQIKRYLISLSDEIGQDIEAYLDRHPEVMERCADLFSVVNTNKALLKLHHIADKRELEKHLKAKYKRDPIEGFRQSIIAIWENRRQVESNKYIKTVDGVHRYVNHRWQVAPGYEEDLSRVMISIVDLTDRKKVEEELETVNLHLEDKVNERTRALAQSMEKAESASRAKSEFLARMSHEIRTPINAITGLTNLILKSKLNPKQTDFLKKVRESSNHLLAVINDILDYSKIEEGKLEIVEGHFMLNHVIGKVGDILGAGAARKSVGLYYIIDKAVPLSLVGDALRLNQILLNLMGNSIKFTEKGEIVLKIQKALDSECTDKITLLFSVKDTGLGIPADRIDTLFEPFTQADGSMTRKYGGTGLGLSICQRLVAMMGGKIWAESVVGQGSTFYFTLPFSLQPEASRYMLLAPNDLKNLKVMVVDDNENARIIFKEMLEAFDSYRVTTVDSGEKAFDQLHLASPEMPYDLILLDWKMPDMDGFEVADRIRHDPLIKARPPKIIMVTMYGREEIFNRTRREKTGIDRYLLKPVSSSELFNSIMEVFGHNEALIPRHEVEMDHADEGCLARIRHARILLVEDNYINQNVAIAMLEDIGLSVDVAENGRIAIDMLNTAEGKGEPIYDAVLMDIEMPEMSGYEATQMVRKNPFYNGLPIIAMTAHALKGDREKCLAAGMNDYIAKPIDEQVLHRVLCRWIRPVDGPGPDVAPRKQTPSSAMPHVRLPDFLPGIDMKTAREKLKGNTRLLRNLLHNFTANYKSSADTIGVLLASGKIREAERIVHTVKGVAGNLCADDLFSAAKDLEDELKQGYTDQIDILLDNFSQRLTVVSLSIESLVFNDQPVIEGQEISELDLDLAEIEAVANEMVILLENNRVRGWQVMETLLSFLPDTLFREDKAALEKCMAGLDTGRALSVLSDLSRRLNFSMRNRK